MKQLEPIKSLAQLKRLASDGPLAGRYKRLAQIAASNLGHPASDPRSSLDALNMLVCETDEEGVVAEVNFCLDLEARTTERE